MLTLLPLAVPLIYIARVVQNMRGTNSRRVLVIPQLTRIGDIVCSTPVFRALALAEPSFEVTVLVSKKAGGIIANNPRIHRVIYLEDYKDNLLRLFVDVARMRFSVGISLSGTVFSSLLFFYGLIPTRIKLVQEDRPITERLTDWTATHRSVYKNHTFLPGFYLSLLEPLGIYNPPLIKEVFSLPEHDASVEKYFSVNNVRSGDLLVGISITAGNKIKEWGDDNFLTLSEMIIDRYSAKIVVLGGPGDRERIDALIAKSSQPERYIRADAFSLEELPAVMAQLKLYIAVDTGPIYVAHALGIPLIDIVGPVDPREQPPSDERSIAVCPPQGVKPSAFVFKKAGRPEEHIRALESITPEMVMSSVATLLPSVK